MRTYEAVTSAYFLLLAIGAPFAEARLQRRALGCVAALAASISALLICRAGEAYVRDWLPLAYIAAGYWIPALLAPARPVSWAGTSVTRFEDWLLRSDAWLRRRLPGVPQWAVAGVELAYLSCYLLVPLGFLVVAIAGTTADLDWFWTVVLLSGFACYGTLPWLASRPPRTIAAPLLPRPVAHVNVFVLDRVSHGWNTFPSGHVAMSVAVAAALAPVSVTAAAIAAIVAVGVAVGAAAGRYHYIIDVLIGPVVALASVGVVSAL